MMYGYNVESIHDPFIEAAEKCVKLGAPLLTPGGSLINLFPILAKIPPWVPGASSQKTAVEVKRLTALMQNIPLDRVTKEFVGCPARVCAAECHSLRCARPKALHLAPLLRIFWRRRLL